MQTRRPLHPQGQESRPPTHHNLLERFKCEHARSVDCADTDDSGGGAVTAAVRVYRAAADGQEKSKWPLRESGNFPMAVDRSNGRVLIVSRHPPTLTVYAEEDGAVVASLDTCGDSDDLFIDPRRPRVYISCGAGFIDVFEVRGTTYSRVGRIKTIAGARTSLLIPELDIFVLAVRATMTEGAAVWTYSLQP